MTQGLKSIIFNVLPEEIKADRQRTYYSITVEREELINTGDFANLHTVSHHQILKGNGYDIGITNISPILSSIEVSFIVNE